MAAPQSFRNAFHGFNREDVVHYIEYITAKHNAQISELNAEIEFLKGKLENHPMETVTPERLYEAELQRDEYKQQLEQQAQRIRELEAGSASSDGGNSAALELAARCAALEKELSEALAAKEQAEAARNDAQIRHTTQELEAYRRAERTERIARERAEQVYHKANGALADATARVDDAAIQISEMTDKVMEQLQLLQQAVTGSRQALTDAAVTMYSIRPNSAED